MLSLNMQAPEKPVVREDGKLDVVSIFKTIQGEGPLAGTPAIFVRLSGCNLRCGPCDTDYTRNRCLLSVNEIQGEIEQRIGSSKIDLVVLTGGEPFRQRIGYLVNRLTAERMRVQIETNGTLFLDDLPRYDDLLTVVCSPKTPSLSSELLPYIDAYKYILDADHVSSEDGLPTHTMGFPTPVARPGSQYEEVYVQPLDEQDSDKNKRNEQAAIASCMKYGYRLSYQIHKHLGLE